MLSEGTDGRGGGPKYEYYRAYGKIRKILS